MLVLVNCGGLKGLVDKAMVECANIIMLVLLAQTSRNCIDLHISTQDFISSKFITSTYSRFLFSD